MDEKMGAVLMQNRSRVRSCDYFGCSSSPLNKIQRVIISPGSMEFQTGLRRIRRGSLFILDRIDLKTLKKHIEIIRTDSAAVINPYSNINNSLFLR